MERLGSNMLSTSTLKRLLSAIQAHDLDNDPRYKPGTYFFCMDNRLFDDPEVPFYPDVENRFKNDIDALEYMFEEGLPIWLVRSHTCFPQNCYTLHKLELLFPDILY